MRLEWTLRGKPLARANEIMESVAEDWDNLCKEKDFAQKGNLLIIAQTPWDNSNPYLALEDNILVYDGDRTSFQIHCLPIVLDIFDAQTRQECPSPEIFDTLLPDLAWWQAESDMEDMPPPYLTPTQNLAAA